MTRDFYGTAYAFNDSSVVVKAHLHRTMYPGTHQWALWVEVDTHPDGLPLVHRTLYIDLDTIREGIGSTCGPIGDAVRNALAKAEADSSASPLPPAGGTHRPS